MEADEDSVFIVGSGPSLEGFDFNLIMGKDTIAVNYAAFHIPQLNYFITADSGVIKKTADKNFLGLDEQTEKVVVIGPGHSRYYIVKGVLPKFDRVIRPKRFDGHIGFSYKEFATGKNTGFCALQFAVILGYKKIYLLGIDLGMKGRQKYFYEGARDSKASRRIPPAFFRHFKYGLKRLEEVSDVKVISCSKVSKLNECILYVPVESVLDC